MEQNLIDCDQKGGIAYLDIERRRFFLSTKVLNGYVQGYRNRTLTSPIRLISYTSQVIWHLSWIRSQPIAPKISL